MPFTEQTRTGTTSGTTAVNMLSATERAVIRNIRVWNRDTVSATLTVNVAGTDVFRITLQPNYNLLCDDIYVLAIGQVATIVLSGAVTTTEPTWAITYASVT